MTTEVVTVEPWTPFTEIVTQLAERRISAAPVLDPEGNDIFRQEAASARYQGILGVSEDPLVSGDIIGDDRAAVVDLELTRVVDGALVKVMAWYDNEWGFTSQMIREARSVLGATSTSGG